MSLLYDVCNESNIALIRIVCNKEIGNVQVVELTLKEKNRCQTSIQYHYQLITVSQFAQLHTLSRFIAIENVLESKRLPK